MKKWVASLMLIFIVDNALSQDYDIYGLRYDSLSKAHFVSVDILTGQITDDSPLVNVNIGVPETSLIIPDSNHYIFAG